MPTPFYHLRCARDLLAAYRLPDPIRAEWPAFCFGNIAPDTQTLSGQTRLATHFFDVPMRDLTPAWEVMFAAHPALAHPARLPPAQAAFLAGYICHLALDQLWITDIFDPVFGPQAAGEPFQQRLFLHNVLRVYLDRIDAPTLQGGMAATLARAESTNWLPFITDAALRRWRDFVAHQLVDGAQPQTIEVFATRMGVSPTEFESLLQSPSLMQTRIFDRLPRSTLAAFRARGLARCYEALVGYLSDQKA
jgi:hypothetical protein